MEVGGGDKEYGDEMTLEMWNLMRRKLSALTGNYQGYGNSIHILINSGCTQLLRCGFGREIRV